MEWNFKKWIMLAGSLWWLNILSCGSYENPVAENKIWKEAPVKSLKFYPARKYISGNEKIGIQINGLQLLYQCAYINQMEIQNFSPASFQLDLEVIWPKNFYDCPLAPTGGLDTNILVMFDMELQPLNPISLLNSEGLVTDSTRFAPFPHLAGKKIWAGLDSSMALDSLYTEILLKDSLSLNCGDSLSFGMYCRTSQDSLMFLYGYTRGWSASGCIDQYNIGIKEFTPWIQPLDTNLNCGSFDILNMN